MLRLSVSALHSSLLSSTPLFSPLLSSFPAIYAALSRYSLVCTTQNYCQVLQVTMTTKATSEWNVAYAARTMTPWLHALTHTHTDTHTQTNRRKDRRTFITAHNDAGQEKVDEEEGKGPPPVAVAQIFVDNGCENWRRVIAVGLAPLWFTCRPGAGGCTGLCLGLLLLRVESSRVD